MSLIKNVYFWSALGAAFVFGIYIGNFKFDKEKSELYNTAKNQEVEINSLKKELVRKDSLISTSTNIKFTD